MKKIILFLFIVLGTSLYAEDAAWFVNSGDAKTFATQKNVPILLVFAGSDWCKPCMQLKATILKTPEFSEYHADKFAVLYLDFPMHAKNQLAADLKKQNDLLAEKYNKSGFFPNLVMINTQGKVIGTLTFKNQDTPTFMGQCDELLKSANPIK